MKLKSLLLIQTIAACLAIISFAVSVWQAFWGTWWVSLVTFILSGIFWSGYAKGLQPTIRKMMNEGRDTSVPMNFLETKT